MVSVCAFAMPLSGTYNSHYRTFDIKLMKLMQEGHVPGGAIAIAKHGQIVYERGFGYANVAKKLPVQVDSVFRLASTSKTLTAVGVLKLISEGKLSFNTKVYSFLGLHPLKGERLNSNVKYITVKNLLEMSSGWSARYDPMFGPWPDSEVRAYHLPTPMSCETTARYMMGRPVRFTPGRTFGYENINYCLLGLVIAKATSGTLQESAYNDYMQKMLATADVHDMYLGSTNPQLTKPEEVHYYRIRAKTATRSDGYVRENDFPYGHDHILRDNYPNAGWVASAPDLAKFMLAVESGRILPKHYANYLWNAPRGKAHRYHRVHGVKYMKWPYGMGMWRIQDNWEVLNIGHGSFTGTNTMILRKPDGEIDVALFNARPGYNMAELWMFREHLISLFVHYA